MIHEWILWAGFHCITTLNSVCFSPQIWTINPEDSWLLVLDAQWNNSSGYSCKIQVWNNMSVCKYNDKIFTFGWTLLLQWHAQFWHYPYLKLGALSGFLISSASGGDSHAHQYQELPSHSMSLPSSSVPSNTVLHSVSHRYCTEVEKRLEMMQRQLHRWDPTTVVLLSWHSSLFIHIPWAVFVVLFFQRLEKRMSTDMGAHNAVASEADGAGSTSLQLCDITYRESPNLPKPDQKTGLSCQPFRDRNAKPFSLRYFTNWSNHRHQFLSKSHMSLNSFSWIFPRYLTPATLLVVPKSPVKVCQVQWRLQLLDSSLQPSSETPAGDYMGTMAT